MTSNINNTTVANYGNPSFKIPFKQMDSPLDSKETEWINDRWPIQWGYFNEVSELQNAILMKGIWNTGKGWKAEDDEDTAILENISGWGKDTFDDIIFNADIVSMIGGDSYTQIIKNGDKIVNLKPLDPGYMKIILNSEGRIKEYIQMKAVPGKNEMRAFKRFKPSEIFHISYNRLGNQIHGISKIDAVEKIIKAEEKSFEDMQKLMSFQAKPFVVFKLKTDDKTKINSFVAKVKDMRQKGDDLFIPDDENLLEWEIVQISPSQVIMTWRDDLRNKFYRAIGLPQIVPGGGTANADSDARVIYLAFEHLVKQRQMQLEKQIWNQLALKVKFNPPTTMLEMIGKDESKDAGGQFGGQASEFNPAGSQQ